MRKSAKRIASILTRTAENIGAFLMLAIIVVNFLQVFFRYVVVDPLGWTEEVMRYSVVWVTFITAGAVFWHGEHMVVDVIGRFCPANLRKIQKFVVLLSIIAFCLVMAVYGLPLAIRNMHQFSPSARITMIIPYMAVVVGSVLMIINVICLSLAPSEDDQGGASEKDKGAVE